MYCHMPTVPAPTNTNHPTRFSKVNTSRPAYPCACVFGRKQPSTIKHQPPLVVVMAGRGRPGRPPGSGKRRRTKRDDDDDDIDHEAEDSSSTLRRLATQLTKAVRLSIESRKHNQQEVKTSWVAMVDHYTRSKQKRISYAARPRSAEQRAPAGRPYPFALWAWQTLPQEAIIVAMDAEMPNLLDTARKTKRVTLQLLNALLDSLPSPPDSPIYDPHLPASATSSRNSEQNPHQRLLLLALWFGPAIFSSAALLSKIIAIMQLLSDGHEVRSAATQSESDRDDNQDSGSHDGQHESTDTESDKPQEDLPSTFGSWDETYEAMVETVLPTAQPLGGQARDVSQVIFCLAASRRLGCRAEFNPALLNKLIIKRRGAARVGGRKSGKPCPC